MRLDVRPGLTVEQRVALFDAAVPHAKELLLAGATSVVVESDGNETLVVKSDKLPEPRVVAVREGE